MGNSSTQPSKSNQPATSPSSSSTPSSTRSAALPLSSLHHEGNALVATIIAGDPKGGAGFRDGNGSHARFDNPCGLTFDHHGDLLVCDRNNHRIRRITSHGDVTTWIGNGTPRYHDGKGTEAMIEQPLHMVVTRQGQFVAIERQNIARINHDGEVTSLSKLHSQSLTIDNHDRIYFGSASDIYEMNVTSISTSDQMSRYNNTTLYGSSHSLAIANRDAPLVVSLASGLRQFTRIDSRPLVRDITGGWSGTPPSDGIGMDASVAYVTDMAMDHNGGTWMVDAYTTTIRYMYPWLAALMPRLLSVSAIASLPPGLLPMIITYLDMHGYGNQVHTYDIIDGHTYTVIPLLDAWGVTIDTHGYVYVTSRNTHCIYRLTTLAGGPPSPSGPAVPLTTLDAAHFTKSSSSKDDNENDDNDNDKTT